MVWRCGAERDHMKDTANDRSHPPNPLIRKIASGHGESEAPTRVHGGSCIPWRYRSACEADQTDGAAYGEWRCEHSEELLLSRIKGNSKC